MSRVAWGILSTANIGVKRVIPAILAGQRGTIAAIASRDALIALGYQVEWHTYAMEHSVCMEEIADLNRWLLRVLK